VAPIDIEGEHVMKNLAIIFAVAILAGCSGMRSSGAGASGATASGTGYGSSSAWGGYSPNSASSGNYATTADPRLGLYDVRMGSQNALEGPFSGLTWRQ
jgi:hypothetical protein